MKNSLKLHIFPAGRNVSKAVFPFLSPTFSAPIAPWAHAHRPVGAENFRDKNGWMADWFVMLGL